MSYTACLHSPDHCLNDNVSVGSSSSSSFTTAYPSLGPSLQLRRVKTVSQLTRWASKRLSRSSLRGIADGTELSEKNLNNLNLAITTSADNTSETNESFNSARRLLPKSPTRASKAINTIAEDLESSPDQTPEKAQDIRLRDSYSAFCEQFTTSGPQRPKRKFDISMDMLEAEQDYLADAQPRVGCTDSSNNDQKEPAPEDQQIGSKALNGIIQDRTRSYENIYFGQDNTPAIIHPRPPPHIMTPLVYQDMQRVALERKLARRQKVLGPIRSLFSKGQPLRGQRLDIET
ncbi:hypothetical protein N7448_005282 [Penicillium atrosanguineum]|uniref:Efflux pump dotC n=1 Tax=Penicillium atrosanguineum TaxID=1132637 RepID=UPI0023966FDB|nr:Efflux pump dotC [Penicillium atrosanguineum]KAJ5136728.1 hypothetical protein N7448_005282 [Penicillium atrosanguineum]KAJ5293059.1 Efflux pump dotC [Penicillium atrosanguineum]